MGKLSVGRTCLANGDGYVELDGIRFRSDLFLPNQFLAFTGGEIVTAPASGTGAIPTKPYRIVGGQAVEYNTIQQAVNSVPGDADDIIYIPPGTYTEQVTVPSRVGIITLYSLVPHGASLAGGSVSLRIESPARAVGLRVQGVEIVGQGGGRPLLDRCDITGTLSVNSAQLDMRFSRVESLYLSSGSEISAQLCWIGELSGDGDAVLHECFLGRIAPDALASIRHSGGIGELIGAERDYTTLNIPWQAPYRCVLAFDGSRWKPEPYPDPSGLPRQPFIIRDGQYYEYPSLQEALDRALSGETVWLPPGNWTGGVYIRPSVSLRGLGMPTIVLGSGQQVYSAGSLIGVDIRKVGETNASLSAVKIVAGSMRWCQVLADYATLPSQHTWAAVHCVDGTIHQCAIIATSSIWHADAVHAEGSVAIYGSFLFSGWANSSAVRTVRSDSMVRVCQTMCAGGISGPGGTVHLISSKASFVEGAVSVIDDLSGLDGLPSEVRIRFPAAAPTGAVFVCGANGQAEARLLELNDLGDVSGTPNVGDVLGYDGSGWRPMPAGQPGPHASSHQDGGVDEISVEGLSGRLADYQKADQIGPWPVNLAAQPSQGSVLMWDGARITWGTVHCEVLSEAGARPAPDTLPVPQLSGSGIPAVPEQLQLTLSESPVPR